MQKNPFVPIYKRCNSGTGAEKLADRPDFPILIDIELTNLCNFSCKMCETGMKKYTRAKGFMSEETFTNILDQIAPAGRSCTTAMRMIGFGEPTLHPQWLEFIKRAKSRGVMLHLNTNGSNMSDENMQALVNAGLDSLKFSFQGATRATYLEMRGTDFFDELLARMGRIKAMRTGATPYLQISTTIVDETAEETTEFRKKASQVADYVNVGVTRLNTAEEKTFTPQRAVIIKKEKEKQAANVIHPVCYEIFHKLSCMWDGTIVACCLDNNKRMVLGNLSENSLQEAWDSNKHIKMQKILSQNGQNKFPHCASCIEYIPLHHEGSL